MDPISIKETLNIDSLLRLSSEAGDLLKSAFYQGDFTVHTKADKSPVSNADLMSSKLLTEGLLQLYPKWQVVSEEDFDGKFVNDGKPFWLIDPLDGTKDFINKSIDFVVCIALISNRRPIFGLIHSPMRSETLYAQGNGAFLVEQGATKKINCRKASNPLTVVDSKNHSTGSNDFIKSAFPNANFKKVGSAYKLCLIAKGEADLHVRLKRLHEWDIAAADIIINSAGGQFRSLNGSYVQYGDSKLMAPHYFASGDQDLAKKIVNSLA